MTVGLRSEVGVGVVETPFVWLTTGCGAFGLATELGATVWFVAFGGGDSVGVGYR